MPAAGWLLGSIKLQFAENALLDCLEGLAGSETEAHKSAAYRGPLATGTEGHGCTAFAAQLWCLLEVARLSMLSQVCWPPEELFLLVFRPSLCLLVVVCIWW